MSHWHVIFDVEMTVFFIFFYFVLLYFSTEDKGYLGMQVKLRQL